MDPVGLAADQVRFASEQRKVVVLWPLNETGPETA